MRRLIASFSLLILLAGTFAPMAAAMPMPMQASGAHCARKPLPLPQADATPACHHHHAAQEAAKVESVPSDQILDSSQCCCDHECCRSLARSQWAQVARQAGTRSQQPAAPLVVTSHDLVRSFELALFRPVRAPPLL
jgi:hypothetical protein